MGVALSMGSYKHDLVDAAQLNAGFRYFNANTKLTVENGTGTRRKCNECNSQFHGNSQMQRNRKQSKS